MTPNTPLTLRFPPFGLPTAMFRCLSAGFAKIVLVPVYTREFVPWFLSFYVFFLFEAARGPCWDVVFG